MGFTVKKGSETLTFLTGQCPGQTGTFPGTNGPRPRDKPGPVPGTDRPFKSTVKWPFCPICFWDGSRFVPGTIVPQESSEKCLCVFCLLFFFCSHLAMRPSHFSGGPKGGHPKRGHLKMGFRSEVRT